MLSHSAEYALKAALYIAGSDPADPVGVNVIAEELGIPRNYLSKVLHQLARDGVLTSVRGRGGGFVLSRPATEVRLNEIVGAFDRLGRREGYCLLNRSECNANKPCAAHESWERVHQTVVEFFAETSLADLRSGAAGSTGVVTLRGSGGKRR